MLEFYLQLFHCSSLSRIRFFSPVLTNIYTYDSQGIQSESFAQRKKKKRKQSFEVQQDALTACATSVYGCRRADEPDEDR